MSHLVPPIGAPCWFELSSRDPEKSLAFHGDLFGWGNLCNDMGGMGKYYFLRNAAGTVGALCGMPPGAESIPSNWGVYFGVENVDASLKQALELGGSLRFGPFDVPGQGRGVVLADPTGAVFSLWQAQDRNSGDFRMFEDYAIGWVELATRDSAAAQKFYGALLGWQFPQDNAPVAAVDYQQYAVAETRFGGIMQMTEHWGDMPSHWSIYVPVPDVDACLSSVAALGGNVCVPAFNAPGVGRIARFDDPAGAGMYVITRTANT